MLAAAVLVSACSLAPVEGGAVAAARITREYLSEVASGEAERGWSFLHPRTRSDMFGDDYGAYETLADETDWSGFRWSVGEAIPDDSNFFMVAISIRADRLGVPAFLMSHQGYSIVPQIGAQGRAAPGAQEEVYVYVRFGDPAGVGIWANA